MKNYAPEMLSQIKNLLEISIALSAEDDQKKILEMILSEARKITGADAGTIYLREDDYLKFKISHNDSLNVYKGVDGDEVDLPKVLISKDNVSGYSVMLKETINIEDVYKAQEFDFSGPKKYDKITGYKTKSMLVVPLLDHVEKVIGVLQLINAQNEEGETVAFAPYYEKVVRALASQAAVSLVNKKHLDDIQKLLYAFVKVMATVIDQRSPYNANHTYRIAKFVERVIGKINDNSEGYFKDVFFNKEQTEELIMAAWLHDIGKMAIPLSVMDKVNRLGGKLNLVLQRLEYIEKQIEFEFYKKKVESDMNELKANKIYNEKLQKVCSARELIKEANSPDNYVDKEMINKLENIAQLSYVDINGNEKKWLQDEELKYLSVAKGTLTAEERKIMQDHVKFAREILDFIPFPERIKNVPRWIEQHHEFLDGSGYPEGLENGEISLPGRILAFIDIFDALIADDRPYKKAMGTDKALSILKNMVEENKLDRHVYNLFYRENIASYLDEIDYNFLNFDELGIDN